jgi:DNA polymerase I
MSDTKEAYITSTETLYPGDTNFETVVVRLYARVPADDPRDDPEAVTITARGFNPHFLIKRSERGKVAVSDRENLLGYEDVDADPLSERFDGNPEELARVNVRYPHSVPNLRDEFEKTWGADTIFTERFRIETGIRTGVRFPVSERRGNHFIVDHEDLEPVEIKDVEPRVMTLDIETDDRDAGFPDPGEARILSIAVHDSYTGDCDVFLDLDGDTLGSFFDLSAIQRAKLENDDLSLADFGVTEPDSLVPSGSEKNMLTEFGKHVQETDPDLIVGWNSGDGSNDGFDLPHIIERMKLHDAAPARLSRENEVEVDHYGDDFKPKVTGRSLYDLMDGWGDTKFTEPRSFKLDDVAADALDDTKIEHQDMGYFEMYEDDPVKFVNYNVKDVRLTVGVNEEEGVLGFKKRLKDIIGVDWRRTHQNNEYIEMCVRRKCAEHGLAMITAQDNPAVANSNNNDEVNYEGAHVESAFNGVKHNVCGVDLASLYPMTQWMLNASPDTRIEVEGMEWYELKDQLDGEYVVAANGQKFRTDHDGIIRELVDEYHELKKDFKRQRNAATYGTDEWETFAEIYNVLKTVYNSFYGYSGWDRSPLYNPDDAAAVTLTGQRVIKATSAYISENAADGASVVYGDTDSNYVEFPEEWSQEYTLGYAEKLCSELENIVYPELCDEFGIPREDNRWEIEVEMRAKRFFMSDSKKNYAYLKMWDEGDDLDEKVNGGDGKFDVTGYPCVKSNFSRLTQELQESVLESIVRGASKEDVVQEVYEAACSIDAADPDWDRVGIPQGLGKKIDPERADEDAYYSWSTTGDHPRGEAPRAVWFANHLLDVEFSKGDKPLRAKLKPGKTVKDEPVDVIAFNESGDLPGDAKLDAQEAQRKCIENPMEDILKALGIEPGAALMGETQSQSALGQFM